MAKVIYCKETGIHCNWIVGGECPWEGRAETEEELLEKVKNHAQKDHGLPELPPPIDMIESTEILKKCINARVALAELKQAAELIPNAAVLVNTIPLLEARASSEIENIVTTTDKLFEFADIAEDRADAATKEALRYRTALFEGTKMVLRTSLRTRRFAISLRSSKKRAMANTRSAWPRRNTVSRLIQTCWVRHRDTLCQYAKSGWQPAPNSLSLSAAPS